MAHQADFRALELLSQQAGLPLDDVTTLYTNELGALTEGARIMTYVPVLAIRRVRRLLREAASLRVPAVQNI